mmetsp:Transcript_7877/g.11905  ORF Transcript_7877/g.11905 Transcript_7877/m.11905 type:complete len:220 (-) Transcript_7877:189-848(-)
MITSVETFQQKLVELFDHPIFPFFFLFANDNCPFEQAFECQFNIDLSQTNDFREFFALFGRNHAFAAFKVVFGRISNFRQLFLKILKRRFRHNSDVQLGNDAEDDFFIVAILLAQFVDDVLKDVSLARNAFPFENFVNLFVFDFFFEVFPLRIRCNFIVGEFFPQKKLEIFLLDLVLFPLFFLFFHFFVIFFSDKFCDEIVKFYSPFRFIQNEQDRIIV